jgi:hypothetical protein
MTLSSRKPPQNPDISPKTHPQKRLIFTNFAKKSPKNTGFLNCFGVKIPFAIPSFETLKFASCSLLASRLSKTLKMS